MKLNFGKMILATMIMSLGFSAKADVCESKDGWKVETFTLGPTRVPGDTFIEIYDPVDKKVVNFLGFSPYEEKEPGLFEFEKDKYIITKILSDHLGLKSFSWYHYNKCLRCSEDSGWYEQNYIQIITENKSYTIHCNK